MLVAGASILLAAAMVAAAVSQMGRPTGHTALLQALRSGQGGPVQYYYIPASEAKVLVSQQQQLSKKLDSADAAAASPQYTIYNSGVVSETAANKPKTEAVKKAVHRMQLPDNFHWGTNGQGLDPEWKCTVPNLVALYNFVQPEWEKCKDNANYIEPNAVKNETNAINATGTGADDDAAEGEEAPAEEAAPSTLGWLYKEVEGHSLTTADVVRARQYKAEAQRFVKHKLLSGPTAAQQVEGYFSGGSHSRRLLTDWDNAPVLDDSSATMKQCLDFALGNLCSMLSNCDQPICDTYYNETEIEGLCGMCEMRIGDKDKGCFASHAAVVTASRGRVTVGDLKIGDVIESAADGGAGWARVIFLHDHVEPAATLELTVGSKQGGRHMALTGPHLIHLHQPGLPDALVPARNIKVGDSVYVVEGGAVTVDTVRDVRVSRSSVRYVVTDTDVLLVDGVVAAVYSTAAGWVETLPFRFLDLVLPGVFSMAPVKASLFTVLESPVLNAFEKLVNIVSSSSASSRVRPSESAHLGSTVSFESAL